MYYYSGVPFPFGDFTKYCKYNDYGGNNDVRSNVAGRCECILRDLSIDSISTYVLVIRI